MPCCATTAAAPTLRWIFAGLAATAALPASGCTLALPPPTALAPVDRATFPEEAGPLLAQACGDAKCHGRTDRPLRLYAVGRLRLLAANRYTATPLQPNEWDANYNAVLGFVDAPAPRQTTLLRKGLGQMAHGGKAVFEAPSDPQFRALEAWLSGKPW